jgi:hypothetical protein
MTTAKETAAEVKSAMQKTVAEPAAQAAENASAMFETALAAPLELSRFCAHRMGRDLETMQAISRCRTPAELIGVWTEAAQAAAEDYRDEVTRMMDIVANGAPKIAAQGGARSRKK